MFTCLVFFLYAKIKKLYALLVCMHIFLILCASKYRLLTNLSRFSSSCAGSSFEEVVDLVRISHVFVSSLEDLYPSSFHWKTPLPKLTSFGGTLSLFFLSHKILNFQLLVLIAYLNLINILENNLLIWFIYAHWFRSFRSTNFLC